MGWIDMVGRGATDSHRCNELTRILTQTDTVHSY